MRPQPALLLAVALLAGAPLAAQPALTGPEISIDPAGSVPGSSSEAEPVAAATDATGHLLVVWSDGESIHGRGFDATGAPLGPPLLLAPRGLAPSLAADSGGFLLAWTDVEFSEQAQTRRILARRLDPAGRPRGAVITIQGPFRTAADRTVDPVQVTAATDGPFAVVWNQGGDVRLRRFDAAGRPRGDAAALPRGPGDFGERSVLALDILDGGAILMAWSSESGPRLWVRRFDPDGAPLAAPVQVLSRNDGVYTMGIAFGPDGGFLAGWTSWQDESPDDLHLRAFDPAGTPLSEQRIEDAGLWSRLGFRLAAEPGGTFLAAWKGGSSCPVSGLQLDAGGSPRGPVGCLTRPSIGLEPGAFATTGTEPGGFALFWSQAGRNGEGGYSPSPRLYGQRLATRGPGTFAIERARSAVLESVREPQALHVLRQDGTAGTVSVEVRLTGAVTGSSTVTFPDGDATPRTVPIPLANDNVPGNDRIIRVALRQPTGGAVLGFPRRAVVEVRDDDAPSPLLAHAGPLAYVGSGDTDTDLTEPSVAASAAGGFEVAWGYIYYPRYSDDVYFGLQGQRFDAAGKPRTAFDHDLPRQPGQVRLAMHPAGDFAVFWQEQKDQLHPPFSRGRRFDAHGAADGPAVRLQIPVDDAAPLPGGRFVTVGPGRDEAGAGLFATLLSGDGGDGLESLQTVPVTRGPLEPGTHAAVASDGAGRFIVVWSAAPTGDGPAGVLARRYDASGSPLGSPFRVSVGDGHDVAATVSTNVPGSFVVAWQRSWDGQGSGVYARAFNAAGAPLSPEIPVNSDTEGNEGTPAVALAGDGRFLVLWESLSGLSCQLFTETGVRLGSEAQLDANGSRPTAAWSDRGYFVTVFFYYGEDIVARRLPV